MALKRGLTGSSQDGEQPAGEAAEEGEARQRVEVPDRAPEREHAEGAGAGAVGDERKR